ncbi:Nephrin [Mizuhopecten yessoensis]|uniref:Nephrin n=1 Tax=Mizuhopecten yessoensis TaxID=6573 RepID=A0A210QHW2_MIZYE|nr:Nephrin [Mizuhopecten yessoensis]
MQYSVVSVYHGQAITPVYVQSNAPVTLTCTADDQATTLTWTGPGGTLYVTGTTVEAGLDDGVKPRISARHTGGSYTLTFTEFRSSDTGIYTCTVDGTADIQMVVTQGVTSARPVYTRLGGTKTLQCNYTGGRASWSVTSILFIYTIGAQMNPDIQDSLRTRLNVTTQDATYNLQISDVQLTDIREYKCSIVLTDTFYHLLLYIPPAFPVIENTVSVGGQNRTIGTEDTNITLTCNARGGVPVNNVSWIKDGATLVTSENTVQYTKVLTRTDDRAIYTCQSNSPALTSPQTTSVLVYLDLKPRQPTISDRLSQTENRNLQVVCVSTGSRPAADIEWNVGGTRLSNNPTEVKVKDIASDTYTVTSTLSLPVTRQDNGKSVYCIASNQVLSGGIKSVRHSITVLYPPDIHVNYTNTTYTSSHRVLTCVPDGNPDTYQFGQWRHTAEDGTEIRHLTGSSSPLQSVLTLPDPGVTRRYEDTGYYVCEASNNIPDSSFYNSGSVFLTVEAPPVVVTKNIVVKIQIGNNATIEVEFYSQPAVSSSDVTWTRGPGRILPPDRSAVSLGSRSLLMSFYGEDVKVKGYIAALTINTLTEEDFGDYTVTIENSLGTTNHTVALLIAGPPLTPLYLLQKRVTSSSITVQWIRGSDEEQVQTFVISYKSDVIMDYSDLDAIPDSQESVMSYTIEGLTPDTTYYIRLYSQNDIGLSDQISANISTNFGDDCTEKLHSTTAALISVSVLCVVVVVIAVTLIVVIYRRLLSGCFTGGNNVPPHEQELTQHSIKDTRNEQAQIEESKSHYQELNPNEIQQPSPYEDISGGNEDAITENERKNYEPLQGVSVTHEYEQLQVDEG